MFAATDTEFCPWHIVPADNKYKARLNCINHLLEMIPHETFGFPDIELPHRDKSLAYDDTASLEGRRFVNRFLSTRPDSLLARL